MFDNFGAGELFMLAVFALLFFGPERLPQMGAKLGQWLGKLTQQSKLFMNQWREEALVIHEAVEEVRGIRDEIAATQRQLADTMKSAQSDVNQSLDEVKGALGGSNATLESLAAAAKDQERTRQLEQAAPKAHGEQEAIEKTQAILANVQAQLTGAQIPAGTEHPQEPSPTLEPQQLDPLAQLERAKMEWRDRLAATPPAQNVLGSRVVQEPTASKPKGPTASERTAQVMERMRRQMAGEPVDDLETLVAPPPLEPTAALTPQEPPIQTQPAAPSEPTAPAGVQDPAGVEQAPEDEWTRTRNLILEGMKGKTGPVQIKSASAPPEAAPKKEAVRLPEIATVVSDNGTQTKIVELNGQVASLQDEIQSLRKALEALRAEMLLKTALPTRAPTRIEE
ncbi:MAG: twin-arginine translocase TatA/TatE family subunit [Anaerolineae bacterium]|nr:twin-arginine translocase TatA/TatE family subunit [Anaerolineae bacterium]